MVWYAWCVCIDWFYFVRRVWIAIFLRTVWSPWMSLLYGRTTAKLTHSDTAKGSISFHEKRAATVPRAIRALMCNKTAQRNFCVAL
jgi:hypothetical protein